MQCLQRPELELQGSCVLTHGYWELWSYRRVARTLSLCTISPALHVWFFILIDGINYAASHNVPHFNHMHTQLYIGIRW